MLRQDFEIGLVGEMRDKETANIALRAGITGHLIFTTFTYCRYCFFNNKTFKFRNRKLRYIFRSRCNFGTKIGKESYVRIVKQKKTYGFWKKYFEKKPSLDVLISFIQVRVAINANGGYLGRTLILEHLIFDDELKEIINGDCNSIKLYDYFSKKQCESLYKNV